MRRFQPSNTGHGGWPAHGGLDLTHYGYVQGYGAAPTWLLTVGQAAAGAAQKAGSWAAQNPETVQQLAQTGTQLAMQWKQNRQTGQMELVPTNVPAAPVYLPPPPAPQTNNTPLIIAGLVGGALILGAIVVRRKG